MPLDTTPERVPKGTKEETLGHLGRISKQWGEPLLLFLLLVSLLLMMCLPLFLFLLAPISHKSVLSAGDNSIFISPLVVWSKTCRTLACSATCAGLVLVLARL